MTLGELLRQTSFEEIWRLMDESCREDEEAYERYRKAYGELRSLEPEPPGPGDWTYGMTLVVKPTKHYGWDVFGRREDAPGQQFGLTVTPWRSWLALPVHPKALERFSADEIAVHCLWEML